MMCKKCEKRRELKSHFSLDMSNEFRELRSTVLTFDFQKIFTYWQKESKSKEKCEKCNKEYTQKQSVISAPEILIIKLANNFVNVTYFL